MRWMFIGAATQLPVGFMTGSSSGATTFSQPSCSGEIVEIGGHAGLVPLGDLRALQLHGRRRIAGDHVGAQLGQRIGGVAGDRGLLPGAALRREHLAELGDSLGVGAGRPLMQQIGLGFGQMPRRQDKCAGCSGRNAAFNNCMVSSHSNVTRSFDCLWPRFQLRPLNEAFTLEFFPEMTNYDAISQDGFSGFGSMTDIRCGPCWSTRRRRRLKA